MAKVRDYSPLSAFGPLTADSVLYLVRDNGDGTFSNVALKVDELRLWALAIHKAESPPHTPGEIGADPAGTAAAAVAAHEAAGDPHSQYATDLELAALQSTVDEMKNGLKWIEENANFTVVPDEESIVRYRVDTAGGAVVGTLPVTFDADGQAVIFTDQSDTWDTNNFQLEIPGSATYTLEGAVDIGGGVFRSTYNIKGSMVHIIYDASEDRVIVNDMNSKIGIPWGTYDESGTGIPDTAPTATGTDAIALGDGASASGLDGISIGTGATSASNYAISAGKDANASNKGTAIGRLSQAATDCIAIGTGATGFGADRIAIGQDSLASANYAVSIGRSSQAGFESVALARNAIATGSNSVAIGQNADALATQAISIGNASYSNGDYSISIGAQADTNTADKAIAIGRDSEIASAANEAIAIGQLATANHANAIALGKGAVTKWTGHFAIKSTAENLQLGITGRGVQTTDATPTNIDTVIPFGMVVVFSITVVGKDSANSLVFEQRHEGVISNFGGTTAIVGSVTSSTANSSFATAASSVSADDATDSLRITVTGEASKNIDWATKIDTVEV